MMTKSLHFAILMALLLSACSGKAAASYSTEPPQTPTITSTVKAPSPADTSTSIPTIYPTNQPDCTDQAAFVSDVTVPDGTIFNAGETFTKTWRVNNIGTCAWDPEYTIVYSSGEKFAAPDSAPLAYTAAGEALDISVNLTTPAQKGSATTYFELHNPEGRVIPIDDGRYLFVSVYSSGNAAPTSSGPAPTVSAGSSDGPCSYTTDPAKVADVIAAINSYRTQNGRSAYTVNPLLTKAAEAHAADMACNNLFVHTGTDGSNSATRVAAAGYSASSVTENVYGSFPPLSGPDVVAWWAADQVDPRHNENLLSATYIEIGVAYTFFNNFGYYVIDFAKP
ncbi:MAG: hypothetical protein HZB50_16450 [Chloroflexi bacterium]|nr:hypothetical protein [Chloroflexota bacterium]